MKIVVWSLVGILACSAPSPRAQSEGSKSTVSSEAASESASAASSDFANVLHLGKSRESDARERLLAVGNDARDIEARLASRRMVGLWSEDERTYFSKVPLPLHRTCVDDTDLAIIRGRITEGTRVDVEVHISASGAVEEIAFRKGTGDDVVDKIIADSLRKRRFLPAKPGDDYMPGIVHVNCWIEVR